MVIFPSRVGSTNQDWLKACALMKVLPLDTRIFSMRNRKSNKHFIDSVDDILERPMIYVDSKEVPAPYFQYTLRFNVSASVHGQIPVGSELQLYEFTSVVTNALNSPLTVAEKNRWIADSKRVECERKNSFSGALVHLAEQKLKAAESFCYYDNARRQLESVNAHTGNHHTVQHIEVLDLLIQQGLAMLEQEPTAVLR